MKYVAVFLLAFIAAVVAGPINVSENNVGDIVTVGINANLEISNKVEQNIISIIVALLNQQKLDINLPNLPNRPEAPNVPEPEPFISKEMIDRVRAAVESRRQ